jgi:hypothetical protein
MITVWVSIVAALAILAAVILPLTASAKEDNMRKIERLMDAHEANLRSGDPAKVAESKERWRTMCRSIQANSRMAMLGLDLERWGDEAARRLSA